MISSLGGDRVLWGDGKNRPKVVIASQEPTVTVREARESKSEENQK